jgi:hypothetical protein
MERASLEEANSRLATAHARAQGLERSGSEDAQTIDSLRTALSRERERHEELRTQLSQAHYEAQMLERELVQTQTKAKEMVSSLREQSAKMIEQQTAVSESTHAAAMEKIHAEMERRQRLLDEERLRMKYELLTEIEATRSSHVHSIQHALEIGTPGTCGTSFASSYGSPYQTVSKRGESWDISAHGSGLAFSADQADPAAHH